VKLKATAQPDVSWDVPDELRDPPEEDLSEMFVKKPKRKKRRSSGEEAPKE
jgi:hypothetical protein